MKGASVVFSSARVKQKRRARKAVVPVRVPSDLWQSPESLIKRVRKVGKIALDPCTSSANPVRARRFFTKAHDGLNQEWDVPGDEIAYANYPYSESERWLERAAFKWNGSRIVLGPARTDTGAWHEHVWGRATRVCFLAGRLVFDVPPCRPSGHDWGKTDMFVKQGRKRKLKKVVLCRHCAVEKPTSAPFPSALILYSTWAETIARFEQVFATEGRVIRP